MDITVLIVDDTPVDRRLAGVLLEDNLGLTAAYAEDGEEALAAIEATNPALVLADLQMPQMDGLALVERIKIKHPWLPIVLMTGYGSEDIALQALRHGAVGYVSKKNLTQDIVPTVSNVLQLCSASRHYQGLLECLTQTEAHLHLRNDPLLIPPLIHYLEGNLARMKFCDGTEVLRVAVALREALMNAMEHGNLEVNGELREFDEIAYYELIELRRSQSPYQNRQVHVMARETPSEAVYVIRDEGPGFDLSRVPDLADSGAMETETGRGLLLIRAFMDEVHHNAKGNEITLIKRRRPS